MNSIQKDLNKILAQPVVKGITTGISSLDDAIKGLHPGHLVTIAAVSSAGKSSLMRSMILAAATEVPVGVFPIEGGTYANVEVMLYTLAQLNYHNKGNLNKGDKSLLEKAKKQLRKLHPIYFDQKANTMYPAWILERGDKENSIEQSIYRMYKQGTRIFFIDYLQLINWGFKSESETLRIKEFTGKLAGMAIELNVPIICLAQLKKSVADRALQKDMDPTPTLNDIRDSGFITNDSFEVLLLHRPEYFKKSKELGLLTNCSEEAKIIVAKQRYGPVGFITVKFSPFCMRWHDLDEGKAKGKLF